MGQKMGKKTKKGEKVELSDEALDAYIRAEFKAMDSISDNDDSLHRQEIVHLLTMLGYSKAHKKLKSLHVKNEEHVSLEDYTSAFKADKELVAKTMRFRQLFQMFDTNNDGTASKEEVIAGLEKNDIKVDDDLRQTIEKMDANADGKITYQEFLAMEFKITLNKGQLKKETKTKKEKKKSSKKEKKSKKKDEKEGSDSESEKEKDEKEKQENEVKKEKEEKNDDEEKDEKEKQQS